MYSKIKLLEIPNAASYLLVITEGVIHAEDFEQIFHKVAATSESMANCKYLIDVENAVLRLEGLDIHTLDDALGSNLERYKIKIAFVSPLVVAESRRVRSLGNALSALGMRAAVFHDAKSALTWLGDAE
jgi:hypothetical protein